jgi:hypothetical protein
VFKKEVSPKAAAIGTIAILAVVQMFYWRALVYTPTGPPGAAGGGGGAAIPPPEVVGRADVTVDTLAGDAPGLVDGPIWKARFSGPNALALASDGTLYVCDSGNHRIRALSPDRTVSTVIGGGAGAAALRYPSGLALAKDGTLYISDTGNHRICRFKGGQLSTLAGGKPGKADGAGVNAAFRYPGPVTVDGSGALWVADVGNQAIRRVDANGTVSSPGGAPEEVVIALGDIASSPPAIPLTASDVGVGPPLQTPHTVGRRSPGIRLPWGRLFADPLHHTVVIQQGGAPAVLFAGRRQNSGEKVGNMDGPGYRASFATPCALVLAPGSVVYVADYEGNRIRRVTLPPWALSGSEIPQAPTRRFGRATRGS